MIPINVIADFFILQADSESGDVMTHLKLQKLVYYAQAWQLAIKKKPLFNNIIQAWAHGPVCPVLWKRFKDYGYNPIPATSIMSGSKLSKGDQDHLNDVWSVYGQFTAKRLEEMTHSELPWIEARKNAPEYQASTNVISHSSMKEFYSKQLKK